MLRNEHLSSSFYLYRKTWKNISINLKITLAILNDQCYYIDKDRYRFDVGTSKEQIVIVIQKYKGGHNVYYW